MDTCLRWITPNRFRASDASSGSGSGTPPPPTSSWYFCSSAALRSNTHSSFRSVRRISPSDGSDPSPSYQFPFKPIILNTKVHHFPQKCIVSNTKFIKFQWKRSHQSTLQRNQSLPLISPPRFGRRHSPHTLRGSRRWWCLDIPIKIIIFNAKFIIFNAKFIIYNEKSINLDTQFIDVNGNYT